MSIFYLACLAEGTGLRLALSETQKTRFLALWLDSSRTNISSARPTEPGNGGGFDFLATGLWYDIVLTAHLPGLCVATNEWCT